MYQDRYTCRSAVDCNTSGKGQKKAFPHWVAPFTMVIAAQTTSELTGEEEKTHIEIKSELL